MEKKEKIVKELTKEDMIKDIEANRLIPSSYKNLLKQAVYIPDRVQQLEKMVVDLAENQKEIPKQTIAGFKQTLIEAQERQNRELSENPNTIPPNTNPNNMFLQLAMRYMFGQSQESETDKYIKRLGQYNLIESQIFDRTLRRQFLKNMSKTMYADFDKAVNAIFKDVGEEPNESQV